MNFENFTFKVDGCIVSAKSNLQHSRDSVTKMLQFSFDEVNLNSKVKSDAIIF